MELKCPNRDCGKPVSWSEVQCPGCGDSVTFGSRVGRIFRRFTLIACPRCRTDVSWREKSCAQCGQPMTVEAVFRAGGFNGSEWLRRLINSTDDTSRRRFQLIFLLASVALLCGLLTYESGLKKTEHHYGLLIVFMPVVMMLFVSLTPLEFRAALMQQTSARFKLAMFANLFSFTLGFKFLILKYEGQAETMAALIGVFVASTILIRLFFLDLWLFLWWLFYFPSFTQYQNPQDPQGPDVRQDYR